jgi:hemerythrin
MKKYTWTEEYSVKVKEIDEQHQRFFDICNQIINLSEDKEIASRSEELIKLVGEFADYANYHLDTEEKYFKEFKYENIESHLRIHKHYRIKLAEFIEKLKNNNDDLLSLAKEIAVFSGTWLFAHILEEDKQYVECFTSNGLG